MIVTLLFVAVLGVLGFLTQWLPSGFYLPFGIDPVLISFMSTIRAFAEVMPPITDLLTVITAYIGFRLGLLVLKFFMGHRAPVTN